MCRPKQITPLRTIQSAFDEPYEVRMVAFEKPLLTLEILKDLRSGEMVRGIASKCFRGRHVQNRETVCVLVRVEKSCGVAK